MRVKLATTLSAVSQQIGTLEKLESGLPEVGAKYQPLVAELIVLRLFSVWEQAIAEVSSKIACGALYCSGTAPGLLGQPARSMVDAMSIFSTRNRVKARSPRWSKASYVVSAVEHVIDSNDSFLKHLRNHGPMINEIRVIRNYSAHRNKSARSDFKKLVKSKFGAELRVAPGQLLLTPRLSPMLLRHYLVSTEVALSDICSGS